MPQSDGVQGVGVTPLVNGAAVSTSNPLPVSGGAAFPVPVNAQQEAMLSALVAGDNVVVAAVATKRIFVTGYNFSLGAADTVSFRSGTGPGTIISAQGVGVVGGNEIAGSTEAYLFATAAGAALNFRTVLASAVAGLQVRYRVES